MALTRINFQAGAGGGLTTAQSDALAVIEYDSGNDRIKMGKSRGLPR